MQKNTSGLFPLGRSKNTCQNDQGELLMDMKEKGPNRLPKWLVKLGVFLFLGHFVVDALLVGGAVWIILEKIK